MSAFASPIATNTSVLVSDRDTEQPRRPPNVEPPNGVRNSVHAVPSKEYTAALPPKKKPDVGAKGSPAATYLTPEPETASDTDRPN
jgi:hypothetical protein